MPKKILAVGRIRDDRTFDVKTNFAPKDRADDAAFLANKDIFYAWLKAEYEDLRDARAEEDWKRRGC